MRKNDVESAGNPRDYTYDRYWYIDKDAKVIARGPNDAVVYSSIMTSGRNVGKPIGTAFQGKRGKPDWNYIFQNQERLDKHIAQWFKDIESRMEYMGERKISRTTPATEQRLVPGTILYSSWGYDQTNIDFYRVVRRTGSYVWLAPMGSHAIDDSHVVPHGVLSGKKLLKKKVQVYDGEESSVRLTSYSSAYPWDGRPKYETPWGQGH